MRSLIVVGLLLAIVGIFTVLMPSSYTDRDYTSTGNITQSRVETVSIPSWAGIAAIGAGAVLMLLGASARRRMY